MQRILSSTLPVLVLLFACSALAAGADKDPVMTDKDYKPLLGAKRFHHYVDQTVLNPGLYGAALGSAIWGQIKNDPPEWGQGLEGYGDRAASNFGQLLIQASIHDASAAAFHLDPRYVRSGQQGVMRRFGHAIKWTFVTYDNDRNVRPNVPIVLGAYGSTMIETLWYPARYNPWKDGVRWGTQQLGFSAGINVIKEFQPELMRLIKRR